MVYLYTYVGYISILHEIPIASPMNTTRQIHSKKNMFLNIMSIGIKLAIASSFWHDDIPSGKLT